GRGRGGRGPGSRLGGSCARLADAAGRGTWLPPHDPSAGAVAAVGIIDRLLVGRPALIGLLQELRCLGRAVRGGAVASLGVMPGPKEFEHTGRRRLEPRARRTLPAIASMWRSSRPPESDCDKRISLDDGLGRLLLLLSQRPRALDRSKPLLTGGAAPSPRGRGPAVGLVRSTGRG